MILESWFKRKLIE